MSNWKIKQCDDFEKLLKSLRISFERPSTYHFQIMTIHNFYPTKGTYYNSDTEKKKPYPKFKSHDQVMKFIGTNTKQLVRKVCKHCGSDNVVKDAWARWDELNQRWVLDDFFDTDFCKDCDGETTIIEA